jgi:hypothetical protein
MERVKQDTPIQGHLGQGTFRRGTEFFDRLPSIRDSLPASVIRPACRWYKQEGPDTFRRCPQIVTHADEIDEP